MKNDWNSCVSQLLKTVTFQNIFFNNGEWIRTGPNVYRKKCTEYEETVNYAHGIFVTRVKKK